MAGDQAIATMDGKQGLVPVDVVVLILYFGFVLAVGLGVSCQNQDTFPLIHDKKFPFIDA